MMKQLQEELQRDRNHARAVEISDFGLVEMPRNREMSACCGNAAFVNCNGSTRLWQLDRLKEARETGTSALVTACPKCLIHLSCAGMDNVQIIERKKLPIVDLHVLAASRIKG